MDGNGRRWTGGEELEARPSLPRLDPRLAHYDEKRLQIFAVVGDL
jgi:hypothetical protein